MNVAPTSPPPMPPGEHPHPPSLPGKRETERSARHGAAWAWLVPISLLVAFAVVTLLVWRGATDRFDAMLLPRVQAALLPHRAWFWGAISWPGYGPQSLGVAGVFVYLAWRYRGRRGALLMLAALVSSPLGSSIKHLIARPRPTPEQAEVVGQFITSFAYPSGHVLTYTVTCGLLVLLIRDALPAGGWERRREEMICGILAALVLVVGPSRMALGDHWPTDVFGAYLLGGALLTLLAPWRHASTTLPLPRR